MSTTKPLSAVFGFSKLEDSAYILVADSGPIPSFHPGFRIKGSQEDGAIYNLKELFVGSIDTVYVETTKDDATREKHIIKFTKNEAVNGNDIQFFVARNDDRAPRALFMLPSLKMDDESLKTGDGSLKMGDGFNYASIKPGIREEDIRPDYFAENAITAIEGCASNKSTNGLAPNGTPISYIEREFATN
jgi:hypothetical protein